jgi:hypothetical protein
VKKYRKIKILPYVIGSGSWDDGEPLDTIVYADVWNGAEAYVKGRHYLDSGDYFYGSTSDITPERSRFAHKDKFEEMYIQAS